MDVISTIMAVVMVLFFCFVYWGVKNLSIKPPELKDSEKNEPTQSLEKKNY